MILFNTGDEAVDKLLLNIPVEKLKEEKWIVIPISDNGVFYGRKIAKKIGGEYDRLFSEPIYAPNNKNCEIAVVSETEEIIINKKLVDSFEIEFDYIYGEAKRKHDEQILSYMYKYRKGEMITELKGRNVLLVDEGADTGFTLMVALKTVMNLDVHKVAVALPIVPKSVVKELSGIVDDVFYVHKIENYVDTRHYYGEETLLYGNEIREEARRNIKNM